MHDGVRREKEVRRLRQHLAQECSRGTDKCVWYSCVVGLGFALGRGSRAGIHSLSSPPNDMPQTKGHFDIAPISLGRADFVRHRTELPLGSGLLV